MSYKIGSFNCLNFGISSSKNIQTFADIIVTEAFDIIALQEIKSQLALDRIISRLPNHWVGIADNDSGVNDYAFIWNSRRFELANTPISASTKTYYPRIYKQYKVDRKNGQRDLIRDPFFARFFPVGGAAPYIEIRIINTHIRYKKGKEEVANSNNNLGAISMRKNEFDVLTKAIYAKESDKRYGNNRPAYTILLGDYNLNLPSSYAGPPYILETFEIFDGNFPKIITTVQNGLTTLKTTNTEDQNNNYHFSSNYDHFTYDANRFQNVIITSSTVNTVEKYYNNDYVRYKEEVSDHIPVIMNIEVRR